MGRIEEYRARLRVTADWDPFLLAESGLPGPRGNIELAMAAAEEGNAARFRAWAAWGPDRAPTGTREEFLSFCGVVGQGKLLAAGDGRALARLRKHASDPRWRVREAVAMALQAWGDADRDALFTAMEEWTSGPPLEQRAAAAAVCEPRLLASARDARRALGIVDGITARMEKAQDRQSDAFLALRKGMGYCWSVAVAAGPQSGRKLMEKWAHGSDRDVQWIIRENLGKNRLVRMDPDWVAAMKERLGKPRRRA